MPSEPPRGLSLRRYRPAIPSACAVKMDARPRWNRPRCAASSASAPVPIGFRETGGISERWQQEEWDVALAEGGLVPPLTP